MKASQKPLKEKMKKQKCYHTAKNQNASIRKIHEKSNGRLMADLLLKSILNNTLGWSLPEREVQFLS